MIMVGVSTFTSREKSDPRSMISVRSNDYAKDDSHLLLSQRLSPCLITDKTIRS